MADAIAPETSSVEPDIMSGLVKGGIPTGPKRPPPRPPGPLDFSRLLGYRRWSPMSKEKEFRRSRPGVRQGVRRQFLLESLAWANENYSVGRLRRAEFQVDDSSQQVQMAVR